MLRSISKKALQLFKERGAFLCNPAEKTKLEAVMFDKEKGVPSGQIVGQSPQRIAELAGFRIPDDVKLLMVPLSAIGHDDWMSHKKLSPVLGWYIAADMDAAIDAAIAQLELAAQGIQLLSFPMTKQFLKNWHLKSRPAGLSGTNLRCRLFSASRAA